MTVIACPTAAVEAPAGTIWRLLTTPDSYRAWAGAEVRAIDPPGPAVPGQRIEFRTRELGRWWRVDFTIGEVTPPRSLALTVRLPFGVVNHEHVVLQPLSERQTRVTFN